MQHSTVPCCAPLLRLCPRTDPRKIWGWGPWRLSRFCSSLYGRKFGTTLGLKANWDMHPGHLRTCLQWNRNALIQEDQFQLQYQILRGSPPHSAFELSANATKTPLSKRNERKNDGPAHATQVYQIERLGKAGNKTHLHCAGIIDHPQEISIMRVKSIVNSLRKIKGPFGMVMGKL